MVKTNLFWGLILVIAGGLFLADNFGYIHFDFGLLWPVLLILLGVFTLLGRSTHNGDSHSEKIAIPLDGAKKGFVRIEHGAGRIKIVGKTGPSEFLSGTLRHADVDTDRIGDELRVHLRSSISASVIWMFPWNWGGSRREWAFSLNPDVPLSFDIDTGASENVLDLRDLKVQSLELETGASSNTIVLPENAGFTRVDISSGAASHEITVPKNVAADIRIDSGLSGITIDEKRFPRSGSHYISPDFAAATNKVEINVETGVSSVTIK